MGEYEQLVKLKFDRIQLEAAVKSLAGLLCSSFRQLKHEHCFMKRLRAENLALQSQVQLPTDSANIQSDELQCKISDIMEVIAARIGELSNGLHDATGLRFPDLDTGLSVESDTSNSNNHRTSSSHQSKDTLCSQAQYKNSAEDPVVTSSSTNSYWTSRSFENSLRLLEEEDPCQSTAPIGTDTPWGNPCHLQQTMWQEEAVGRVLQTHVSGTATLTNARFGSAQSSGPMQPLRRADVLRPLSPDTLTLQIRNIPARYSQEQLLQEWPPDGSYNMLYMPSTRKLGMSRGYAFLNFVSPDHALAFQRQWHGRRLSDHGRNKHLDVSAAARQGLAETLQGIPPAGEDWRTWRQNGSSFPFIFSGSQAMDIDIVLSQLGFID